MARLLSRTLLGIDYHTHDKYWNTRRRLATGGGNEGYGHKSIAASFVDVIVDCCIDAELVALFGHGDLGGAAAA